MSQTELQKIESLSDLWGVPDQHSIFQLIVYIAAIVAALDFVIYFNSTTVVPYDYYAIASLLHVVVVAHFFPKTYDIGIMFAEELANITENESSSLTAIETNITGDTIRGEMQKLLKKAFSFRLILFSGIITAFVGATVAFFTGLLEVIDYWLIGLLFLFDHGLFFVPAIYGVIIVNKMTNEYITDIDVISPDGVGGYEEIGNGIITIASYALFLTTLDFIVISAISYTSSSGIQAIIGIIFIIWLLIVLSMIVYVIMSIRSRLMEIRDKKFQKLRSQFKGTEVAYWNKKSNSQDTQQEALDMMTMRSMFNELNQMDLWPINIISLVKMSASTGFSIIVFAVDRGLIPSPINFLM